MFISWRDRSYLAFFMPLAQSFSFQRHPRQKQHMDYASGLKHRTLAKHVSALAMALLTGLSTAAIAKSDDWTGSYALKPLGSNPSASSPAEPAIPIESAQVVIVRVADEGVSKLDDDAEKLDARRWEIKQNDKPGRVKLRPFLPAQYKEFNFGLYSKLQTIECLDGGHLFLCKSMPRVPVSIGSGQSFETINVASGIWGVRLHSGAFELIPLRKK